MSYKKQGSLEIENDEISLKELSFKIKSLWKFLLSKRLLIICAGIIGLCLGFIYCYFKKPIYKAELSFALEDNKGGGGLSSAAGLASQFGIDLDGGNNGVFSGDNLLLLLKSRSMIENTLLTAISINKREETLADFYIAFSGLKEKWKNNETLKKINFPVLADRSKFTIAQDSVLGVIYNAINNKDLVVDKADKKSSVFLVRLTSENELFSKFFTEILVSKVSDFYIDTKTKRSNQNVRILQKQADSVRRELNAALSGVATSVDFNPNPNPALQILRIPAQRRQIDVQANQAILMQLVANLEISKVSLRKETPLIQIIDTPILPLHKDKPSKVLGAIIGGMIAVVLSIISLSAIGTLKREF